MKSLKSFEDMHLCVSAAGFETDQDFYGILFIGSRLLAVYWMNCNNNKSSVYTSDFVVYVELNEKIK